MLGGHWRHRLQRDARCGHLLLRRRRSGYLVLGLVVGLSLLLAALELLETLHDCAVRQAFLVLDCRHS